MFLAQLLLTAEPEGGDPLTLEVRYYVNEVRVENFTPQQRLLAGAHTLALFYPFASVEANAAKRLSVRLGLHRRHGENCALQHQGHRDRPGHGQ